MSNDASSTLYVRLPSRVAEENYAIAGGFGGGVLLVTVYVVLICCLQRRAMRRDINPSSRQAAVETPPYVAAARRDLGLRHAMERDRGGQNTPQVSWAASAVSSSAHVLPAAAVDTAAVSQRWVRESASRRTAHTSPDPLVSTLTPAKVATVSAPAAVSAAPAVGSRYHRGAWNAMVEATAPNKSAAQAQAHVESAAVMAVPPEPLYHPAHAAYAVSQRPPPDKEDDDDEDDDEDSFSPPLPGSPPPPRHVASGLGDL